MHSTEYIPHATPDPIVANTAARVGCPVIFTHDVGFARHNNAWPAIQAGNIAVVLFRFEGKSAPYYVPRFLAAVERMGTLPAAGEVKEVSLNAAGRQFYHPSNIDFCLELEAIDEQTQFYMQAAQVSGSTNGNRINSLMQP